MNKFCKYLFVSLTVLLLTACGGGSSPVDTIQEVDAQTVAIDKIVNYVSDHNQPLPTILDYADAGVLGVSEENIDDINAVLADLSASDVDTTEEIQALVDELDIVIPEDTTPPVITLNGTNPMTITVGSTYIESGASAIDDKDGTVNVTTNGTVDTATAGTYTVTYTAEDHAKNTATETRTVIVTAPPSTELEWNFFPSVTQGTQFDAQVGPNNLIHLISSRYYQLDLAGKIVVTENQGDEQQGLLSFPPAIAVGNDGSVHIITRHNGASSTGHDIRYRRRSAGGSWDADYIFGDRVARNYVVSISWTDTDIIMSSTYASVDGLYGDVHLWKAHTTSATHLGALSNIWRADTDSRIYAQNNLIRLTSGKTDPDGKAYFSQADNGTNLVSLLNTNMQTHNAGTGRKGFPDLALDGQNNAHFVYGSKSEVYYNKYNANGTKSFASDKRIFSNLGTWHLDTGLSAVAVSESGEIVVAVALRTNGTEQATNSDLLWTYSTDGGISWSTPQDIGKNSDAGEGRRRPRLVAIGDTFVLLYGDTVDTGISMGVLNFN